MSQTRHRALVVDNDVALQQRTVAALVEHGFECDAADDGAKANTQLVQATYDVVIVDLKMPNHDGNTIVRELVGRANRPLIVVFTEAIDPKLAQELIHRGVDGVLSKPFDFDSLATKVQALVDGRHRRPPATGKAATQAATPRDTTASTDGRMSVADFNAKLGEVSHVLPISAAALDVYLMTKNLEWDLSQIAAAVQRDAVLTTEVLRMANSAYFNPPGRPIVELDEAAMRIGQKRVGELALSINALSSVTPAKIPWMDLELSWNRSMAAGIALELLVDLGDHEDVADGLFVSAIMHPLGRIVLSMLFPQKYAAIVDECGRTGAALNELERRTFPASHTDVMAQLLADWRLRAEVFVPLKFSLDDYSTIGRLLEPMRTKAELVKVAIFLGRLAVGRWESWDTVRIPPASVFDRLRVHDVEQLVRETRSDVARLAEFHPAGGKTVSKKPSLPAEPRTVAYCNFSGHSDDFVKVFLPALGLEAQEYSASDLRQFEEPLIANCLGIDPTQFATHRTNQISIIIAEQSKCEEFASYAPSIGMPNSFSRVREAVLAHVGENTNVVSAGQI